MTRPNVGREALIAATTGRRRCSPRRPYHGSEGDYGRTRFGRDQFARMADRPRSLKGRFLFSINDVPEIRETFAGFAVEEVSTRYLVGGGGGTPARELLVTKPT